MLLRAPAVGGVCQAVGEDIAVPVGRVQCRPGAVAVESVVVSWRVFFDYSGNCVARTPGGRMCDVGDVGYAVGWLVGDSS